MALGLGAKARDVLQKLENNTEYEDDKMSAVIDADFRLSDFDDSSLSDSSDFDGAMSVASLAYSDAYDFQDLQRTTPSEPPDSPLYSVMSLDHVSINDSAIFTVKDENGDEKEKTLRNILQTPENIGTLPDYIKEELLTLIHIELTKKKMLPALQAAIKACTTLTTKSSLTREEKAKRREDLKVYRACTEIYKAEKINDTARQKNERAEMVYSLLAKMWRHNGNPPKEVSQSMSKYIPEVLANMDCEKIFSDIVYGHQ